MDGAAGDDTISGEGNGIAVVARPGIADFLWQDDEGQILDIAPLTLLGGEGDDDITVTGTGVEVVTGGGSDTVDLTGATQAVVYAGAGDLVTGSDVTGTTDLRVVIDGAGTFTGGTAAELAIARGDGAILNGGGGDDRLESDTGSAQLFGGDGNDFLNANQTGAGFRGSATDRIENYTDNSADSLFGGAGDDRLWLARMDQATGGTGADRFTVFNDGDAGEPAVITDFDPAEDMLLIYSGDGADGLYPFDPRYDLVGRISVQETGGDTLVLDGATVLARLEGVTGLSVGLTKPDYDAAPVYTNLTGTEGPASTFDVLVSAYPAVSS